MPRVSTLSNAIFVVLVVTFTFALLMITIYELTVMRKTTSTFIEHDPERIFLAVSNRSNSPITLFAYGKVVTLEKNQIHDLMQPSRQVRIDYPASLFFRPKRDIYISTLNKTDF